MARNLTTVVLPYVADNSVLKCLGQHCTQLVYLDIANSWNIDEDGIFNLLFKVGQLVSSLIGQASVVMGRG